MKECLVVNDGFQSGIEIISVTPLSLDCVWPTNLWFIADDLFFLLIFSLLLDFQVWLSKFESALQFLFLFSGLIYLHLITIGFIWNNL
jgi:hypothetical protein